MKYLKSSLINKKRVSFPIYLPDATLAVTKSLDSQDLKSAKIEALVVNTYHLMTAPGVQTIRNFGGVGKFMDWNGLIVSDSGGFQLLSIIYRNRVLGKVTDNGVVTYEGGQGKKRSLFFTPEKSISVQFNLKSDLMICLDDCPAVDSSHDDYVLSVRRTVAWAKRCKEEFLKIKSNILSTDDRAFNPSLFAVIQGGNDLKLREKCADELLKIGFDGYAFGGWPIDKSGNFDHQTFAYTANLMPDDKPKFALGVGDPVSILKGFRVGYNLFDCVLPTRDARHKRLYVYDKPPYLINLDDEKFYSYLNLAKTQYKNDFLPLSKFCDCHTCQHYSKAYLYHLFKIGDHLAFRLATIHNLRFYSQLIERLRNFN